MIITIQLCLSYESLLNRHRDGFARIVRSFECIDTESSGLGRSFPYIFRVLVIGLEGPKDLTRTKIFPSNSTVTICPKILIAMSLLVLESVIFVDPQEIETVNTSSDRYFSKRKAPGGVSYCCRSAEERQK